jgi:hypothetical protein
MENNSSSYLNIVVYNGTFNRINVLASAIRLARKSNRKIHMNWTHTPVRSCLAYFGEYCKYEDIFEPIENLSIDSFDEKSIKWDATYEYRYWENRDHIVDISKDGNIFVNFALYTLVSTSEEDLRSEFRNFKKYISEPKEFLIDNVGKEIGDILKNEIIPQKCLRDEINKYEQTFFENMIGVHIRKTDGGFENFDWKNMIKTLLDRLEKWCKEDKNNGIYLATDDKDIYIEFVIKLNNRLIFYNPPEVLNNTKSTSSNSKFNNDKYNVLCGVIECYLLSKCNKMIIGTAESTFSACALLMSNEDTKKYLINNENNIPNITV